MLRLPADFPMLRAALAALLPSACALCGRQAPEALCAACRTAHFDARCTRCLQCARPLPFAAVGVTRCGECLRAPPAFDATVAAIDYAAPGDQLVLQLKFRAQLVLAPLFAQMLRDAALQARGHLPLPELLVAVPLGAQRLADRGFNQAHEIARPLARSLGVPLRADLVRRERDTIAQTLLPPGQRRRNLRRAFAVHGSADDLNGLHVGVVDDVITTGETLNALAAALKKAGAARVTNFVFARTIPK